MRIFDIIVGSSADFFGPASSPGNVPMLVPMFLSNRGKKNVGPGKICVTAWLSRELPRCHWAKRRHILRRVFHEASWSAEPRQVLRSGLRCFTHSSHPETVQHWASPP